VLEGFEVTHDGGPTSLVNREESRRGRAAHLCGVTAGVIMAATALCALVTPWGGAARAQIVEGAAVRHITVTVNKSKTLTFPHPFFTAVIGAPEIADLLPMTEHSLYVQGKKIGTTNISVFDANKRLVAVVDLEVAPDAASVHGDILATTGARSINVSSANGEVVLSGEASDAVSAARAVDVAKGLSPSTPVINAMTVAPSQQVMLKVRFLEADRTIGRDFGVNWFGGNKNGIGFSGLGNATATPPQTSLTPGVSSGTIPGLSTTGVFPGAAAAAVPFGSLLAQVVNTHGVEIGTLISALEANGLVKTLAEPDVIAQSGEKASFFAGSQVPIPTVQPGSVAGTTPTVTVQYYPCGITLNFIPTVLNTGLINLHLTPDVCEVATTSPVIVNGTTIPELTERSANTTVELRDGQSFAIAGLLQVQDTDQLSQLPWIGSVPVLGALFRSTNYQKAETDLVVIVTVHLVRPVPPSKHLATPFDNTLQSNDVDLFLMGDVERKKKFTEFVTSGGGLQGPYGHILDAK
jgi:pilus assembly protein CpaC